jgi:hypothetical protein
VTCAVDYCVVSFLGGSLGECNSMGTWFVLLALLGGQVEASLTMFMCPFLLQLRAS